MESEYRCQFGMAIAAADPDAAHALAQRWATPATRCVSCALAQTRGTGVSTRLTELELARAISGVPPRIGAVAAIAVAIHREFDQTPRVLDDVLGATIADLAQIATDVARAHSIELLAPAVHAAGKLRQVPVIARAIKRGDQRAEALIALARHMQPDLAGVDRPDPRRAA